jgi:hypothetical protein
MMRRTCLLPALCLAMIASCTPAPRETSTDRPAAVFRDADGHPHRPLEVSGRTATVLLFISPDCPMSNGYAPEMSRIAASYAPRGVAFFAVHSDPHVTPEEARTHAREYGIGFPVIMDPGQDLAAFAHATMTPEAAVIDREERVVYLGRIDNLYYGFGKRRAAATSHELRDALDAVLAGKRIIPRVVREPIGCEIPPPPSS